MCERQLSVVGDAVSAQSPRVASRGSDSTPADAVGTVRIGPATPHSLGDKASLVKLGARLARHVAVAVAAFVNPAGRVGIQRRMAAADPLTLLARVAAEGPHGGPVGTAVPLLRGAAEVAATAPAEVGPGAGAATLAAPAVVVDRAAPVAAARGDGCAASAVGSSATVDAGALC